MTVNTLIVSDVHLGTPFTKAENLLELLHTITFKRLILLGDIFDDLHYTKLSQSQWDLLSYIRQCATHNQVIWVRGNHDKKLSAVLSRVIGATVCDEYIWHSDGVSYLAIHGDQFDSHLITNKIVGVLLAGAYYIVTVLQFHHLPIPLWMKSFRTKLLHLTKNSASKAIQYAITKKVNIIFCGHTHEAHKQTFIQKNGKAITYFNTGCWTRLPSTYITIIDKDIAIKEYPAVE